MQICGSGREHDLVKDSDDNSNNVFNIKLFNSVGMKKKRKPQKKSDYWDRLTDEKWWVMYKKRELIWKW